MAKLIVGCGYLGRRVAERWRDAGEQVYVVTRSPDRAAEFTRAGFLPITANINRPETLDELPAVDSVLYAVGYDRSEGVDKRTVYVDGLANVLARLPTSVQRFLYVSSSSVFGQQTGEWVDETSPCEPITEGGRICRDAEEVVRRHPTFGARSVILRLTGIYGPGRVPRQQALRAGEPIAVAGDGFLNLIHVDDAASAALAADKLAPGGSLYCITDDAPVVRHDYYAEVARLLGGPPPVIVAPAPGAPVAERAASDKCVSNAKMKRELKLALQFPSYREGLKAILAAEATS